MEETEIDMLPVWVKLNFSKRIMGRVSEVMVRVLISVVEGEGSMTELGSKRMLKVHKSLSGEEGLESLGFFLGSPTGERYIYIYIYIHMCVGLSNKPVDAYKDVSLIDHAFVFYVVA